MKNQLYRFVYLLVLMLILDSCATPSSSQRTTLLTSNWDFHTSPNDTLPHKVVIPNYIQQNFENNIADRPNDAKIRTYSKEILLSPKDLKFDHIRLVFQGISGVANIYMGEHKLGTVTSSFKSASFDVKPFLKLGKNSLKVVYDYTDVKKSKMGTELMPLERTPYVNRAYAPMRQMNLDGIFRSVFLQAWNVLRIKQARQIQRNISPDLAEMTTSVAIEIDQKTEKDQPNTATVDAEVEVLVNHKSVASVSRQLSNGTHQVDLNYDISKPNLWWPNGYGKPYLYNIHTVVKVDNKADTIKQKIGIRTVELSMDYQDMPHKVKINGVPIFLKGASFTDFQTYKPAVTPQQVVLAAKAANLNLLWSWAGGIYPSQTFYDACDENGILVWQDLMNLGRVNELSRESEVRIKEEITEHVVQNAYRPSILLWNANAITGGVPKPWEYTLPKARTRIESKSGQPVFVSEIRDLIKELDPNRELIDPKHYLSTPYATMNILPSVNSVEYPINKFKKQRVEENFRRAIVARDNLFRFATDSSNYTYQGEVVHSDNIYYAMLDARLHANGIGFIATEINSPRLLESPASLDYRGKWKAAHYALKKASAPLALYAALDNDSIAVKVLSDAIVLKQPELTISYFSLKTGEEKFKSVYYLDNQLNRYGMPKEVEAQKEEYALLLTLREEGKAKVLADFSNLLVPIQTAKLQNTLYLKQLTETDYGYDILLIAVSYMKSVRLSFGVDGHFSENFLDMIPNRVYKIKFETKERGLTKEDLKIMSLNTLVE